MKTNKFYTRFKFTTQKFYITLLFMFTFLFSSCEVNIGTFHNPDSFYNGRWEVYSVIDNWTGIEYRCSGTINIYMQNYDIYYTLNISDWPFYPNHGIIEDDKMYGGGHSFHAYLDYERGNLVITTYSSNDYFHHDDLTFFAYRK